jgi:uncharacterized SAM-binding protein YcdF (DUF218 family)
VLLLYLKTLCRQILLPPASSLLLAIAGLWLLRRRPRLATALLIIGLGSLWLLSTPVIALGITRLAQHYPALDPAHLGGAQAIVIIGGGGERDWAPEYRGPSAEPELLERLAYGAYLARRTGLPILVSGNGTEADAMRGTLQQNFELTPRWVEDRAYDTFENARNSAALLRGDGIERILLVTRATHMLRAWREFSATGLAVMPAPVGTLDFDVVPWRPRPWDFVPSADGLLLSYEACYELIGEPVRQALALLHLRRQQSGR